MAILVNRERIDDDTVRDEAERMRPEYERAFADDDPAEREARLQQWARENAIERVLLEQAARANPEPVPAEDVDQVLAEAKKHAAEGTPEETLRADVEQHLRIQRLMAGAAADLPAPSDEAVRAYYEDHAKEFLAPARVHASHIVKHVGPGQPPEVADAEVRKAQAALQAGADFADTAAKFSDCPENGGDLGWFPKGQMVEEFENVVWLLEPGQTSDVFATRFGFHLVRLHEKRPPSPYTLEEVADHIRQHLADEARDAAVEKFLDDLRAKATIEEV